MSLLCFVCIIFGALNGIFLAAMPKMNDPNPSVFRLAALGTVLATILVLLAAAALTVEFWTCALGAAGMAVAAFFIFRSSFEPETAKTGELATPPKGNAATESVVRKAA